MILTLKNLKTWDSEDGGGHSCTVYVDGQRAFTAENEGWGGPNLYTPIGKGGQALLDAAEAWAKAQPEITFTVEGNQSYTIENSLDLTIGTLISAALVEKRERQLCRNKTIFTVPGDPAGQYRTFNCPYDGRVKKEVYRRYPNATIINERYV